MDSIQKILILFILGLYLTLSGCGGGENSSTSDDDTSTTVALKGQLIDSVVSGIRFESSSYSGQTDTSGYFSYAAEEIVAFYVGDLLIGEAEGASLITPIDFVAGTSDPAHPTVMNIVRFLLTIDDDANPDNGIQITQAIHNATIGHSIDFEQEPTVFEAATETLIALLTSVTTAGSRDLVSSETALNHLEKTLFGIYAGAYQGFYSSDIGNDYGIWNVAFLDNGSIIGFGRHYSGLLFEIRGSFEASGDVTFNAEAYGGTSLSSTFDATITNDGLIAATWSNDYDSGTAAGTRVPTATIDLAQYWPLTINHYRLYDVETYDGWQYQERQHIIGTEIIDGTETIQQAYFDSDYSMSVPIDYDLYSLSEETINILGSNTLVDAWDEGELLGYRMLIPPIEMVRNQTIGETQVIQSTETYPDGSTSDITLRITLLGFEDISVTAGDFEDAAMVLFGYQNGEDISDSVWWFVKDIGMVKAVDSSELYNLREYGNAPPPSN